MLSRWRQPLETRGRKRLARQAGTELYNDLPT
jgi:hypothetical protein